MPISTIERAIDAISRGQMIVVVDDENRENEGDIVVASQDVTPEIIAFMMNRARGLICVAMEADRLKELDIPLMVPRNTEKLETAFTVSVDYVHGTTTGISAHDRSATIRALVDPKSAPSDFARPGHVFPLRAHHAGLSARAGHTEAAVALARLAGKAPSGVICEIAKDDGSMARLPDLEVFAAENGLLIVTINDLIDYVEAEAVDNPAVLGPLSAVLGLRVAEPA